MLRPSAPATAPRWALSTAGASCSSATPARSIRPGSCPWLRPVPAADPWSRSTEPPHLPGPARPGPFKGKCGVCEYRQVCGGSRARAYALTGDPLGSDPDCAYLPRTRASTRHTPCAVRRRLVGRARASPTKTRDKLLMLGLASARPTLRFSPHHSDPGRPLPAPTSPRRSG